MKLSAVQISESMLKRAMAMATHPKEHGHVNLWNEILSGQ